MAVRAGNSGYSSASETNGLATAPRAAHVRSTALTKPASPDALITLIDALLHDAPGIVLIVDVDGWIRGSSSASHAVWPSSNSPSSRLHDVVSAELAAEWMEWVRQVIRERRSVAIRGVVRGEWLWTMLRPVEVSSGSVHVLITLRAMTADAIHTPPPGISSSIRVIDAIHHDLGPLQQLSKREIEVLSLVGAGLTTGQIAKALHRSLKTVENHRTSIGRKLNARSLLDLCRMARRAGMPETTPIFAERVHGKGESSHSDMMNGK